MSSYPVRQSQILSRNPQRAAEFYESVFGWTVTADNALAYRTVTTGGIEGVIWPAPPDGHELVQLFLEVPDVPPRRRPQIPAGDRDPTAMLPGGDELAVIVDPENIPFGLFKTKG